MAPVENKSKDEFIHHLFTFMREEYDHGYSSRTLHEQTVGRIDEWMLNTADGRERPRLWVLSRDNTLELYVAGRGEPDDPDIEAWKLGVESALSRLGQRLNVPWTAVIGEAQLAPHGSTGHRLQEETALGELTFRLFGGCVSEDSSANIGGTGLTIHRRFHWPIEVTGSTSCYSWDQDGEWRAMQQLRMVTAMLSTAWDSCWVLREGPRNPEIQFGDSGSQLLGTSWRQVPTSHPSATGQSIAIPQWLNNAEILSSE